MSSSVHVDNKKKRYLNSWESTTQRLDVAILTVEKMYLINFAKTRRKFRSNLHYHGANNYLFLMVQKLLNLSQKSLKL